MAKWRLRKIEAAGLLNLQGDGAGNLFWRGRRLTAADYAKVMLAAILIGIMFNLIRTGLDVGRAAGWWQAFHTSTIGAVDALAFELVFGGYLIAIWQCGPGPTPDTRTPLQR